MLREDGIGSCRQNTGKKRVGFGVVLVRDAAKAEGAS